MIDDNPAIHDDFRKILVPERTDQSLSELEEAFFGEAISKGPDLQIELDSAHQGQEGLKKIVDAIDEERPYAVAFVDMRMPPGWDGLTTIEHLWRADPDLQVVICTAYSDHSWAEICDRLGQSDQLLLLKKPFDNVEVCQLALALTEKWNLQRQSQLTKQGLESLVEERTQELKKNEEALRQKHKLEAIGSLAGGVAHEFNNLLQAIQGYTRFAQDGLDEADQRFQDLDQVLEASNRAASLTSQLLCFSRADEFSPRPTEVDSALEALDKLLKPIIGEQIQFSIEAGMDCPHVMADPSGLQQALLNLCINARDAMEEGGRLTIRAGTVTRASQGAGDRNPEQFGNFVRFSVEDSGTGISAEEIGRIFDPFFTTKEVGKGTGLGLSMVHGFVERHGGEISVDSTPGVGTTFNMLLPVAEERASVEPPSSVRLHSCHGEGTVLVAEDEPMVRAVAERILTTAGYRVLMATNGEEAVELFARHRDEISLVLLDVVMPGITGREACTRIREIDDNALVVFCTGYDPETSKLGSLDQDDHAVVRKPYETESLLDAVSEALELRVLSHLETTTV